MRIVFDPRAAEDLDAIFAWIARDNPRAAADMVERIEDRIRRLGQRGFAEIGRPGQVEGTRELVTAPYIIVYELRRSRGEILIRAIFHGAQKR